jgi:uncharacterized protein YgbK (DUF1537 family)
MPQILIIADDLTGAADTGASLACAGWLTLVALQPAAQLPACDALVLSTASRDLEPDKAGGKVRLAARQARGEGRTETLYVYKKIDSTLRGHPALELATVMGALRLERALVAPAFPAQGRTTRGGRQLLDGIPLEETAFGREVACSDLLTLFRNQPDGSMARHIDLATVRRGPAAIRAALEVPDPGLIVADAETDADLLAIARAGLRGGIRLWCGSAGLARSMAAALPRPLGEASVPGPLPRPGGPTLVLAGSRHPRTVRQLEVAQGWGATPIHLTPGTLSGDIQAIERTIQRASGRLADHQHVILATADMGDSPLGNRAVADILANIAWALVADGHVGGMVLTGGDVAAAVCDGLDASAIWLRGETQPGIPWGILLGGLSPGLPVVTKAGGFGGDNALARAIMRLEDWKAGRLGGW